MVFDDRHFGDGWGDCFGTGCNVLVFDIGFNMGESDKPPRLGPGG